MCQYKTNNIFANDGIDETFIKLTILFRNISKITNLLYGG